MGMMQMQPDEAGWTDQGPMEVAEGRPTSGEGWGDDSQNGHDLRPTSDGGVSKAGRELCQV